MFTTRLPDDARGAAVWTTPTRWDAVSNELLDEKATGPIERSIPKTRTPAFIQRTGNRLHDTLLRSGRISPSLLPCLPVRRLGKSLGLPVLNGPLSPVHSERCVLTPRWMPDRPLTIHPSASVCSLLEQNVLTYYSATRRTTSISSGSSRLITAAIVFRSSRGSAGSVSVNRSLVCTSQLIRLRTPEHGSSRHTLGSVRTAPTNEEIV